MVAPKLSSTSTLITSFGNFLTISINVFASPITADPFSRTSAGILHSIPISILFVVRITALSSVFTSIPLSIGSGDFDDTALITVVTASKSLSFSHKKNMYFSNLPLLRHFIFFNLSFCAFQIYKYIIVLVLGGEEISDKSKISLNTANFIC